MSFCILWHGVFVCVYACVNSFVFKYVFVYVRGVGGGWGTWGVWKSVYTVFAKNKECFSDAHWLISVYYIPPFLEASLQDGLGHCCAGSQASLHLSCCQEGTGCSCEPPGVQQCQRGHSITKTEKLTREERIQKNTAPASSWNANMSDLFIHLYTQIHTHTHSWTQIHRITESETTRPWTLCYLHQDQGNICN